MVLVQFECEFTISCKTISDYYCIVQQEINIDNQVCFAVFAILVDVIYSKVSRVNDISEFNNFLLLNLKRRNSIDGQRSTECRLSWTENWSK